MIRNIVWILVGIAAILVICSVCSATSVIGTSIFWGWNRIVTWVNPLVASAYQYQTYPTVTPLATAYVAPTPPPSSPEYTPTQENYNPQQSPTPFQPSSGVTSVPGTSGHGTWTAANCQTLGQTLGVTLTVVPEGDFVACKYRGPLHKFSIPNWVIADVDRGGIVVAVGPVTLESSNVTFRQYDGNIAEACAQVKNLTAHGQKQNPQFFAAPYNFSCP